LKDELLQQHDTWFRESLIKQILYEYEKLMAQMCSIVCTIIDMAQKNLWHKRFYGIKNFKSQVEQ
jgi:LPS sulfotransferase NodH